MNDVAVQEMPVAHTLSQKKFDAAWKRFQIPVAPHVPALILDAEGTIQHLTPAARRLLEYRQNQPIEGCFFSHVHGRNLYQVMRDVADMVCYGKAQASWLLRLRTGQGRWQWFKAVVHNHLQGAEQAITIVLRDLNET